MPFNFGFAAQPGATNDETVRSIQASFQILGMPVAPTGNYDAATGAAILEFRGAAGLPQVNVIDDALWDAVSSAVDRAEAARKSPTPSTQKAPIQMDPLYITGKRPGGKLNPKTMMILGGLGLLALYLLTGQKKRGVAAGLMGSWGPGAGLGSVTARPKGKAPHKSGSGARPHPRKNVFPSEGREGRVSKRMTESDILNLPREVEKSYLRQGGPICLRTDADRYSSDPDYVREVKERVKTQAYHHDTEVAACDGKLILFRWDPRPDWKSRRHNAAHRKVR